MKIEGISFVAPELQITNSDMLSMVADASRQSFQGNLEHALDDVNTLFQKSGIRTRRYLDKDEPWFPYLKKAIDEAVSEAGIDIQSIDCVVFTSIFRTVLEPSMSCLIAKALGLRAASAFDVNEACGGWARSVSIVQDYLKYDRYKRILVVSAEAISRRQGYGSKGLVLTDKSDLEWAFPTYTIGSGFTATIFAKASEEWKIEYKADNSFAEHCLFPLNYTEPCDHNLGKVNSFGKGFDIFTCYGVQLQIHSGMAFGKFVRSRKEEIEASKIFIPHTQTYSGYLDLLKWLRLPPDMIHSLYPEYGNVVTSSLPGGIAHAKAKGLISRGDRVFLAIPASGLNMSTHCFIF